MTTTTYPASAKQIAFLTRLAAERPGWAKIENLHPDVIARLDKRAASSFIDQALQVPRETSRQAAPTNPVTEPGMYRAADGTIYKVQAARGSGNLYAKKLVVHGDRGDFVYAAGAIRSLTADQRMTLEQAQEFGLEFGVCCVCSRTLTNPDSIAAGIGPVCASRF